MAKIDYKIVNILEELLEMRTGYVLDFSNSSFQRFVKEYIGKDIYSDKGYEEYCSKANKLRQIIKEEPNEKVINLIEGLVDYFEDYKLKGNKLTEYNKKKINQVKEYIKKLKDKTESSFIDEKLNQKIKMISTRSATFEQMAVDEKLKEIGNLIEYLLKENGKFIKIDYESNSLNFINENIVKEFRKKVQCFRHSSKESIIERNKINSKQKKFLIDFGILICKFIEMEINTKAGE